MARHIGIDAIWVRIGWAALSLAGGIGIVAYLLAMYLFPREETAHEQEPVEDKRSSGPLIAGVILIAVAALIVLRIVGVLEYGFWGAWQVAWMIMWPLTLFAGGILLLFVYWRQGAGEERRLRRPVDDRMVFGVCSALGEYLRIDTNLVRFVFALVVILSRGVGLIVYVVIGLLTPEAREDVERE